jgi:ubiquinone/menaquinone biosynthesis C-methylase UbiE
MSASTQELISTKGRRKAPPGTAKALTDVSGPGGNKDVEDFYNRFGWRVQSGQTGDEELFWPSDAGPLRAVMERQRLGRVLSALREAGPKLSLVEAGCGGNPAATLLPLCAHYTGVDFSESGLELARQKLSSYKVPFDLARSDVCSLPFPDSTFDAAYSAHVLYHIDDVASQAKAYREICRVVRPGGRVVLILANPRPLLFPVRMLVRIAADMPLLSDALRRMRPPARLPYRPMTLSWMRRQLAPFGIVRMSCYELESVWLSQHISESSRFGRSLLRVMTGAERVASQWPVRLGNYVLITVIRGR